VTKRIIVYHDNCHDGITALWCAKQSHEWADGEPYAGKHGEGPDLERLRGAHVLIVDFSWKRPELQAVAKVAASLVVLDHHASAEAELKDFPGCTFDMNRSGAGLTWDVLHPGKPRPRLVDYVEDRDLWLFKLPFSREVHAACNCYPTTLEVRSKLMQVDIDVLGNDGAAILRYHDKLVESACRHVTREVIAGFDVPSIACPTVELISDVGHRLSIGEPFAATYMTDEKGTRHYSLRSDGEGQDVGVIATSLGGGGHKHAAGFRAPDWGVTPKTISWHAETRHPQITRERDPFTGDDIPGQYRVTL